MNPPPVPFGDPTKVNQENREAVKKGVFFGCGGCALAITALVGVVIVGVVSLLAIMRNSDVCVQAVALAQASPAVGAELGQPIKQGWWVTGNITTTGDTGGADVTIPISGPKGSATLQCKAMVVNGKWEFSVLQASLPSGKAVDLLPSEQVSQ